MKKPNLLGDPARLLRTRGFVGSKGERQQFRAAKQSARRDSMLSRMSPEQRGAALKKESDFKASQSAESAKKAASEKTAADDKTLRTKGIVGSKEERQELREKKQSISRERALEKMTPEQREKALKEEADAKAAAASKAAAKSAKEKREADDKARRTVAKVGDEKEREDFRADKQRVRRDDMLRSMSPEQRETALKQEADAKAAEAAQEQQEAQAKASRTVAIVGDKAERTAFGLQSPRGTPTFMQVPGLALSEIQLAAELTALSS